MYYIPSKETQIVFKKITIGQLRKIMDLFFKHQDLGFNIGFIETLKINNTLATPLTNFDKEILLLQIYLNEVKGLKIPNSPIEHPEPQIFNNGLYTIKIESPNIDNELKYYNFLLQQSEIDKNTLLLAEITKHITSLSINKTSFNINIEPKELIDIIKKIPPNILAECVKLIDKIKKQIKQFYKQNNIKYKYSIDLLIP